ncbi:GbsR/MarR family transcriptional regulator [Xanthomarina sp. F2636L]|uniref:GbsR/MarR family transcriptional regulator n=1 Tax=Xanthomarina sp. F2636L TaxID=2996018 RepID=UPI00225DEFDC|nr:transcriptional regulator [Xanthomarina sp. F2636L]MCX7551168.1 transcriptional regulator [Xanthomarina sp. F2636L]
METKLKAKKYQLVEKLGVHFENKDQLAPVAARILAYIILTGKKGTTFEDLVSNLCASKSTISTHLTHLQSLDRINYFTKTGDRKKYFIVNTSNFLQDINHMISNWQSEKNLHQEISNYKAEVNQLESTVKEFEFDLTIHYKYIEFLNSAITSISELKTRIVANNIKT